MKRLTLALALMVLVAWGSNAMAASPGGAMFMQRWKAVQSEQKQGSDGLTRIDRASRSAGSGATTPTANQTTPYAPPTPGPKVCLVCSE